MTGVGVDRKGDIGEFWKGAVLILLLGGLLIIGLENFRPFYFTHDDNATQQLPWHVHNYRCLSEYGQLAFINLHQYLGHEHFSSGQTGVLYVPAYIASWFAERFGGSVLASLEVDASLHLLAAMVALYAYCRSIQLKGWVCIYAAIFYGTTPFILIASKSWLAVIYSAFYIPAVLTCLEMWLEGNRIRWLVFSIFLKLLFFYQGNIQFVCFYLFGEVVYMSLRLQIWRIGKAWSKAINYGFSNLVFVVGTLPLSVPMKNYTDKSAFRSSPLSLEASLSLSIEPFTWLKAQVFFFKEHGVMLSSSAAYYLGGSILLLLLLFVVIQNPINRPKTSHFGAILAMFTLCFILGTKANILIHWLPPFGSFRWPFKWYGLCVFAYVALFAIVLDRLLVGRRIPASWLQAVFLLAIVSQLFVIFSPRSQIAFGPYRVLPSEVKVALTTTVPTDGRVLPFAIKSASNEQEVLDTRTFNFPTLYGEYAFGGYDALFGKVLNEKVYGMNYSSVLFEPFSAKLMERLSQWSVRYMIIDERNGVFVGIEKLPFKKIGTTATGFTIFQNEDAKPVAWLEDQPDHKVDVKLQANQIVVTPQGGQGKLILSFLNLPGWKYSIDGQNLVVPDTNDEGQMVMNIPTGSRQIIFQYIPPMLLPMVGLTVILSLLLSLIWWLGLRSQANFAAKNLNANALSTENR